MRTSNVHPAAPDATVAPFNPLVALQSLLSADVMSVKQRARAAQQLDEYFRHLTPTPGLLLSYEPYLPLLMDVLITPINDGHELQTSIMAMLQALSAHNPTGFSDWIAENTQLGNEPWLVQWSYALLLQTEQLVPRVVEDDNARWEETSPEYKQFDRVFARVMQMWRTLLDHTADVALVDHLVKYMQALFMQSDSDLWCTVVLKKLQAHFVDIADVLVGWMMNTGPQSPLREDILALLNNFGRLWADNSVFSLQLMSSFADEIVTLGDLCNYDHEEGDSDRFSILLTCFMMVAQCVPVLALSSNESAQSPFKKVLDSIVACSQPVYSLSCVASSSDYLVSISNSGHSSFAPQSVAAIGFLLHHCAVKSCLHDCEVSKILAVLKNACELASANFFKVSDLFLARAAAIGILDDEIHSSKKSGQLECVKVLNCLIDSNCADMVAYTTRLCLHLVQLGGIGALKVLVEHALQGLDVKFGEKRNTYFVFTSTCFILVSRHPERLKPRDDNDAMHGIAIIKVIATILNLQTTRKCELRISPRQLCLVLKMACTFFKIVSQSFFALSNAVETVQKLSLRILELAISMLPCETVVLRNNRLTTEMLQLICDLMSETTLIPLIPQDMSREFLKKTAKVFRYSSVRVRKKCIQLLEKYYCRADSRKFAKVGFDMILEFLLDPSPVVQRRITSSALSSVVRFALLEQETLSKLRSKSQPVHPSFDGADFETILSLFQSRECDESKWSRICRSIIARTTPDVALGNANVLLGAIRQAGAWCVQNRLRTFFGGPAQSFASFERLLQEFSEETQYQAGSDLQTDDAIDCSSSSSLTYSSSRQLLSWLMLEFVLEVEMRISLAICAIDLDPSKSEGDEYKTALFFRANKVVCDDWLNRIRPFLVEMSKHAACCELNRYHSHANMMICYTKLNKAMNSFSSCEISETTADELIRAEKDLDGALFLLCQCCCDAKDADSIIGYQRWSLSISSPLNELYQLHKELLDISNNYCKMPLFGWLNAVRYEAEMRYEDAAREFEALLDRVLTVEKHEDISLARIFELPIKLRRISPLALLGCIKQCAKCYSALHEWTKLRQLASRFIDLAKSLVDFDYPIEEIQAIFRCSDAWSHEIGRISSLELPLDQPESGNCWKVESTIRAVQALRVWDIFGETNLGQTYGASLTDSCASQLRQEMIPLALQPSPWNGYVGEKIGKKAEEIVLRLFAHSSSADNHQLEAFVEGIRLNSEVFDSVTWSQPYCTPRSGSWSTDAECLHLTRVARLARKQCNYTFAQGLLKEAGNVKNTSHVSTLTYNHEKAKLLEIIGIKGEGLRFLETQCKTSFGLIGHGDEFPVLKSVIARSILHLADRAARAGTVDLSPSAAFLSVMSAQIIASTRMDNILLSASAFLPDSQDEYAYKCFHAALALSPQSAKAWAQYSHWCYDRGKREMEQISSQNGFLNVNLDDETELNSLVLKVGFSERDHDRVLHAFRQILDDGELVSQRFDNFRQLCFELAPGHNRDALDCLMRLHYKCHSNIFCYHALAARGYGKYLTLHYSESSSCMQKQEVLVIVFRMLGLLASCGAEKEVLSALEDVISNGPVSPWSYVIPQVISHAHHSIPKVASLVCLILKRLALHLPHTIVYPAVANAMDSQANHHGEGSSASDTFAAVLQELQNASSGEVEGVRLLVSELRRISILWDEAWISTLVKLSADVSRRINTLEKETNRVKKNTSLSTKEKGELAHRNVVAIMKPIYISIEKLWKETFGNLRDQHAVTPHERNFLKEYGRLIEKAITNFRDCCFTEHRPASMMNAQDVWQPFADVLILMNTVGKREQLPLLEISPALATTSRLLARTQIPGAVLETTSVKVEPTTIQQVNPSVTVLHTKTKPKSLELIGSDGKAYRYLLKAREDLRLDERVMQYLRVTNDFLRADKAAGARDLSAQSYGVIPLSKNAGLIQMVPNVIPLFQVYTARSDASGRSQHDSVAGSSAQQQPSPPTAQFYAKLKQHGISNVAPSNRSRWPASVLKEVYQELVAQRPRNVLQHEVVFQSEDLRQSWSKSTRLIKSLAVMSVLGYIIGLGDRHLDNILLCVNSGDIVHIDHNVCFDKGRKLKVPEIVPFRLTPMLQDALGITGVEGTFRLAFETTLRVVRSNYVREALLTMFDAFVYSPLVDWIGEDKRQGQPLDLKARLEANVNLSLFLSRAEERRQDTIAFGRQYEQCAENILKILTESAIPFATMFEKRKHLLSLERDKQSLSKELLRLTAELAALKRAEESKCAEIESYTAQFTEIAEKISDFAVKCFAEHRQIQVWKQKCITFAESDPLTQLSAITTAIGTVSFYDIFATLPEASNSSMSVDSLSQLAAALETKCKSIDADVARLRFQFESVANFLIPYLSFYGHQRKELDAYITLQLKSGGKDVYFKWWKLCTEYLRGPKEKQTSYNTILTCATPSEEDVAESRMVLSCLVDFQSDPSVDFNESSETLCISHADELLQDVSNALFAMKLSNAQGQRLMKLAGASWIIKVLEQLDTKACTISVGAFTPSLKAPPMFGALVAVTHACLALLNLVSTPKGSMKRLQARDVFASARGKDIKECSGKCLTGFCDVLQEVEFFAVVLQEEFVSNVYGRSFQGGKELLELAKKLLATPTGKDDLKTILSMSTPDGADDVSISIHTMLMRQPGICKLLVAAFALIQKISSLVEMPHCMSMSSKRMKDSFSTVWLDFVLEVVEPFTVTEDDKVDLKVEKVCTIWLAHMENFVSDCLVLLLRNQLISIISNEWKFDLNAHDPQAHENDAAELSSLSNLWTDFFCSQLSNIFPSTLANSSTVTLETQASDFTTSMAKFMTLCEEWWTCQRGEAQLKVWDQHISSLRISHAGRLRYASWVAAAEPTEDDITCLNRSQLMSCVSSQEPKLNALITNLTVLEASVLECAQQMDIFASNLGDTSHSINGSLLKCVQSCISKIASLFEYGRTLADLVQGISAIETSSGEFQLEVNSVGTNLLQSASSVMLEMQPLDEALNVVVTHVQELQGELEQKQDIYDAVASKKCTVESELQSLCLDNKGAVLEVVHELSQSAKEMRVLLQGIGTQKGSSKEGVHRPVNSESGRHQQVQTNARDTLSVELPPRFSFIESDRLVQMLWRSIQSVNHLQVLEELLKKHMAQSVLLRDTISQLDHLLCNFVTQAEQILSDNGNESSQVYTLLQLLLDLIETLQVVKSERTADSTSNDISISPLLAARDLVRDCVKLFFEATEMADRLSSLKGDEPRKVASMSDDVDTEDETHDDSVLVDAKSSVVMDFTSDSRSRNVAAQTLRRTEKSQYGIQVLKRIEEKLSGFVPEVADAPAVLTVEQQASWLIDEATKTDNLCLMYEGWTPWI